MNYVTLSRWKNGNSFVATWYRSSPTEWMDCGGAYGKFVYVSVWGPKDRFLGM